MNMAQTYKIDNLARHLQCAIEDTYGVEQPLVPSDVFATMGLEGKVYDGDETELTFDGDGGIDIPVIKGNPFNGFEFEFYATGSGAQGTPPIASKIFRLSGSNEMITAGESVVYTAGNQNTLDSATLKMFQKIAEAEYLQYITTGARGSVGFSFESGKKGKFKVSGLVGDYILPTVLNSSVTRDWGTQKTVLPQDVDFDNTGELSWNGHDLCVESLSIDNLFGYEMTRANRPGCKNTDAKRGPHKISITFRMPNWQTAFNPYEEQETTNGVNRRPFVFQLGITGEDEGRIMRIEGDGNNEMQMTNVTQTTIGDHVAVSADLRCLTGLKLSYL